MDDSNVGVGLLKKVRIKTEQERMKDYITVDELVGLQEGNFAAIRSVLSRFVLQDGSDTEYMDEAEGLQLVGQMSIRQLMAAADALRSGVKDAVVPPGNGETSA
jgi:hypothetical protein